MSAADEIDMETDLTADHFKILKEDSDAIHYSTDLPFLRNHNGWRKGNLHIFLGKTGGGKSTLMRTLLVDALLANQMKLNVGLILSEEKRLSFFSEFNYSGELTPLISRLKVVSEVDHHSIKNDKREWDKLFKRMVDSGCDIIFYDNPTTSPTYSDNIDKQTTRAGEYKQLAIDHNVPLVLFTHTASVNENFGQLISEDNLRGSKALANQAEFFYVLQTINEGDVRHTFLRIIKHRGQDVKEFFYSLGYNSKVRAYGRVAQIKFSEMLNVFKRRNKL